MGPALRRTPERHVRLRHLGLPDARFVRGPRPIRQEAAVLRAPGKRWLALCVGTEAISCERADRQRARRPSTGRLLEFELRAFSKNSAAPRAPVAGGARRNLERRPA